MPGLQPLPESMVIKPAAYNEHLFGIGMAFPAKRRRVGARVEAREPGVLSRPWVDTKRQFLGDSI
jgi:hypothetical protein